MLLMLDNYDSFTYNLVQSFESLGKKVVVYRNDQITIDEIEALQPTHLCISSGPGHPENAGISIACVQHFAGKIPILGVNLGHLAIAAAFGAKIIPTKEILHGKVAPIQHQQKGLFAKIPTPFNATRYHSLVVDKKQLPKELEITATDHNEEIMALSHKKFALNGVQFHPESFFSEHGHALLENFIQTQETQ